MPNYQFYLENGEKRSREIRFDLPDDSAVTPVAKRVARHFAAREIGSGRLQLAQDVTVLNSRDKVVARYPLGTFLLVEERADAIPAR